MKLPSIIALLLAACFLFVTSSTVNAGDPPPFPGQPHINVALKRLHAAKDKAAADAPGALKDLDAASNTLAHASHNKGTYQNVARQYTDQATEYLQKGEVDKALHRIDEAIAAVEQAGSTGKH